MTARRQEQLAGILPGSRGEPTGGTVGAVALDGEGHLAAATSTGGVTGQLPGRVGDTPIIGAGTWADDRSCAVSATGDGEALLLSVFAHESTPSCASLASAWAQPAGRRWVRSRPGQGEVVASRWGRMARWRSRSPARGCSGAR
ncbi:MAG TPA: isoaspartyl peptidase/L-asparaginase [Pseudonocardiaceae bacterium]